MKLDIKKFKSFSEQTGLGYGEFCAFQLVVSKDKAGLKHLASTKCTLLEALEGEFWIEYYEDIQSDKAHARYKLTDRGVVLAEIFIEDSEASDIREILAYFDEKKKEFQIAGVVNPIASNVKLVKRHYPKFSIEQFKKVIDYFVPAWQHAKAKDGAPYRNYLKPSTLFNDKFDLRVDEAEQSSSVATTIRPKYKPL